MIELSTIAPQVELAKLAVAKIIELKSNLVMTDFVVSWAHSVRIPQGKSAQTRIDVVPSPYAQERRGRNPQSFTGQNYSIQVGVTKGINSSEGTDPKSKAEVENLLILTEQIKDILRFEDTIPNYAKLAWRETTPAIDEDGAPIHYVVKAQTCNFFSLHIARYELVTS